MSSWLTYVKGFNLPNIINTKPKSIKTLPPPKSPIKPAPFLPPSWINNSSKLKKLCDDLLLLNLGLDGDKLVEVIREITELLIYYDRNHSFLYKEELDKAEEDGLINIGKQSSSEDLQQDSPNLDPLIPLEKAGLKTQSLEAPKKDLEQEGKDWLDYFINKHLPLYLIFIIRYDHVPSPFPTHLLAQFKSFLTDSNPNFNQPLVNLQLCHTSPTPQPVLLNNRFNPLLAVQTQCLQSFSILLESLQCTKCLVRLIGNCLGFRALFERDVLEWDDDLRPYIVTLAKNLSFKLKKETALFKKVLTVPIIKENNDEKMSFRLPLYEVAIRLGINGDGLLLTAVKTVSLNIYQVDDHDVTDAVLHPDNIYHFDHLINQLIDLPLKINEMGKSQSLSLQSDYVELLNYSLDVITFSNSTISTYLHHELLYQALVPTITNTLAQPLDFLVTNTLLGYFFEYIKCGTLLNQVINLAYGKFDGERVRSFGEIEDFEKVVLSEDLYQRSPPHLLLQTQNMVSDPSTNQNLHLTLTHLYHLSKNSHLGLQLGCHLGLVSVRKIRSKLLMYSLIVDGEEVVEDEMRVRLLVGWDLTDGDKYFYHPSLISSLLQILDRSLPLPTIVLASHLILELTHFPGKAPCLYPRHAAMLEKCFENAKKKLIEWVNSDNFNLGGLVGRLEGLRKENIELRVNVNHFEVKNFDKEVELNLLVSAYHHLLKLSHWLLRTPLAPPTLLSKLLCHTSNTGPYLSISAEITLDHYLALPVQFRTTSLRPTTSDLVSGEVLVSDLLPTLTIVGASTGLFSKTKGKVLVSWNIDELEIDEEQEDVMLVVRDTRRGDKRLEVKFRDGMECALVKGTLEQVMSWRKDKARNVVMEVIG